MLDPGDSDEGKLARLAVLLAPGRRRRRVAQPAGGDIAPGRPHLRVMIELAVARDSAQRDWSAACALRAERMRRCGRPREDLPVPSSRSKIAPKPELDVIFDVQAAGWPLLKSIEGTTSRWVQGRRWSPAAWSFLAGLLWLVFSLWVVLFSQVRPQVLADRGTGGGI